MDPFKFLNILKFWIANPLYAERSYLTHWKQIKSILSAQTNMYEKKLDTSYIKVINADLA